MKQITAAMTVNEVLELLPEAIHLLKQHGLGKFESAEVRTSLGSVLKLKTALNMAKVNVEAVVESLNLLLERGETDKDFALD